MLIKYNSTLFDPFYGVIDFLDKDLTSSFKLFDTMRSGQIGITGDNIWQYPKNEYLLWWSW